MQSVSYISLGGRNNTVHTLLIAWGAIVNNHFFIFEKKKIQRVFDKKMLLASLASAFSRTSKKSKKSTSKNKKNPDRCLPLAKAKRLSKKALAATAKKKKASGGKKQFVKNTKTVRNA